MNLKDRTIAITGASQGIGRAIALHLASAGADVALIDLNEAALRETQQFCAALGVQARTYVANVATEDDVEQVFAAIGHDCGRLDGLVNNAGIVRDALLLKARDGQVTERMTLAQWRAVIDVNLTGVFLCGRAAATQMVQFGNGGVIVNISSISRQGNVGQSNYSAAKAGVAALGVVWARELGRYGIRVGIVAPGYTRTDILSNMKPDVLEKVVAPVPLKRLGEAEEIAAAVGFIFANDFFTGRCIDIDGGLRI